MSEIEKESLEAHVDLCSERYNSLKRELTGMAKRMDKFESMLIEMRDIIQNFKSDRNKQVQTWMVGIISMLTAGCGALLYIFLTQS